jgi:hypothetical protein
VPELLEGKRHRMLGLDFLWRSRPVEGDPGREMEPTAAYRLGVDIKGGWKSSRKVAGWANPQ